MIKNYNLEYHAASWTNFIPRHCLRRHAALRDDPKMGCIGNQS